MTLELFHFLPFSSVCVNDPDHPRREVYAEARTQRPFAPQYLFIDPAADLVVGDLSIGQEHPMTASVGDVPARVFELRDLARVLGDLRALVDDGAPVTVQIDEAAAWPLPLALPTIYPGVLARLQLAPTDHVRRVVRCAFAGVYTDDDAQPLPYDVLGGWTGRRPPGVPPPLLPPRRRRG